MDLEAATRNRADRAAVLHRGSVFRVNATMTLPETSSASFANLCEFTLNSMVGFASGAEVPPLIEH